VLQIGPSVELPRTRFSKHPNTSGAQRSTISPDGCWNTRALLSIFTWLGRVDQSWERAEIEIKAQYDGSYARGAGGRPVFRVLSGEVRLALI
jgi:hypothetical protein